MAINTASILAKAKAYCEHGEGRDRIENEIDNLVLDRDGHDPAFTMYIPPAWMAAHKFRDVLGDQIHAQSFAPRLEGVLSEVVIHQPEKYARGRYEIGLDYQNDLTRHTMSSFKPYYPINLALLYNYGVDHHMKRIIEYDEFGGFHASLTDIPATRFMENAIDDFMGAYADDYFVIGAYLG